MTAAVTTRTIADGSILVAVRTTLQTVPVRDQIFVALPLAATDPTLYNAALIDVLNALTGRGASLPNGVDSSGRFDPAFLPSILGGFPFAGWSWRA
jgi:hypothetical protein